MMNLAAVDIIIISNGEAKPSKSIEANRSIDSNLLETSQ
jgi:hypothetical protein